MNTRNDGYRYRLPTEAEWEYAARAGSSDAYPGGLDEIAWYDANSGGAVHPVGEKKANTWGLFDMLGNVREWVQDAYDGSYYRNSPLSDPPGPTGDVTRYMRRGGSAFGNARSARVSFRTSNLASARVTDYGFRIVREAVR